MYSRKFGQNGLPPDYGGVSFRRTPTDEEPPSQAEDPPNCAPPCAPRYPTEDRRRPIPSRTIKVKQQAPQTKENPKPEKDKRAGFGALTSHSFTMEDIVLAGLILLLLNSDCDSELLLILGFLLLVGLQ